MTPDQWTVLSMLERITTHFEKHGVPNPRLSIEWLLADVLRIRRLDLYLKFDRPLTKDEMDRLRPMVKRRTDHEPLQYITGHADFLDTRIKVDNRVLIPRQETEQLVSLILEQTQALEDKPLSLLDIGTGSGCIAVALAKARPRWSVTAVDLSDDALVITGENALLNEVNVTCINGDLFHLDNLSSFEDQIFDIIVSNPPYIVPSEKPTLERQVVDYEPGLALFHNDPLSIYRSITDFAVKKLAGGGSLYLECNADLADEILSVAEMHFYTASLIQDYDGNNRFIHAVKERPDD